MHDGLLFLHILGATGWIGAGIYSVYSYSALARLAPDVAAPALEALQRREDFFFGSSTVLVLLSGIGLVLTSDAYGWSDAFVLIGIGAFAVSGALNSTVGKKATARLNSAVTRGEGAVAALKTWRRSTVWEFAALAFTLWAMIAKLGT